MSVEGMNAATPAPLTAGVPGTNPDTAVPVAPQVDQTAEIAKQAAAKAFARQQQMQRQAEAKSKYQALQTEAEQARAFKQSLLSDPLGTLRTLGVTPDQITDGILNQPSPEEVRLREIEKKYETLVKQYNDAQTSQYDEAKRLFLHETKQLTANSDDYELIRRTNSEQSVVDLIERVAQMSPEKGGGYVMTVWDAANEVEKYLREEAYGLSQSKALQSKLYPAAQTPETNAPISTPDINKGSSTLNVKAQTTAAPTLSNRQSQVISAAPMSEKQRRERAILAFQGKVT